MLHGMKNGRNKDVKKMTRISQIAHNGRINIESQMVLRKEGEVDAKRGQD